MHWVVQENLYKEDAFADLIRALDITETSYEIVKVIPFSHEVDPEPKTQDRIMVSGSTALTFIGQEKGFYRGHTFCLGRTSRASTILD